jgi:E3 ubiquitin-protein ligase HECTD2
MPPWSSRLLSPSSRNEPIPNPYDTNLSSHTPARSRVTEANILGNADSIPSLPPPPHVSHGAASTSRPTRTNGHGRSVSHPFPSLFAAKKKSPRNGDVATGAGFESTDDETTSPSRSNVHNSGAKLKGHDTDLMTGKCMTCDSMVRWPKELKVFRCTVCLTINDLKPIALEARRGDGHRAPIVNTTGAPITSRYMSRGMLSFQTQNK